MPTGYTYKVSEGTEPSFESFVLRCSRAFGACINQRDSSDEYPNPNLANPSSYYVERMEEAQKEIDKLTNMSEDEVFALACEEYEAERKDTLEQIEKAKAQQERYAEMLSKAYAWTPPTSEHDGLKTFMIEQLTDSMKFDSMGDYYLNRLRSLKEPVRELAEIIREKKLKAAKDSYDYAKKQHDEDTAREDGREQWILDLFDSLNVDVVDDKVIPRVEK